MFSAGIKYDTEKLDGSVAEGEKSNHASDATTLLSTDVDPTKRELESLQARAVFSLVESIKVGNKIKKLLFLTNNQADMVDMSDVDKFLIAFDIPTSGPLKPKLIITMFASINYMSMNSFDMFGRLPHYQPFLGETSRDNHDEAEERALLFLKQCIIPLAIETNAIVIIDLAMCVFSRLMSDLCEMESGIRGGKLPFTVIMFGAGYQYYVSSKREGSLAHTFKSQSKRWAEQHHVIERMWRNDIQRHCNDLNDEALDAMSSMHMDDIHLLGGATHYIIVDGVTQGKDNLQYFIKLKTNFVESLSRKLPSIGLCSYHFFGLRTIKDYAQYVGKGMPLLMLDSRPVPEGFGGGYPSCIEDTDKIFRQRNDALMKSGTYDFYHASNFAFMKEVFKQFSAESLTSQPPHSVAIDIKNSGVVDNTVSGAMSSKKVHPQTSGNQYFRIHDKIELLSDNESRSLQTSIRGDNGRSTVIIQEFVNMYKKYIFDQDTARLKLAADELSNMKAKLAEFSGDGSRILLNDYLHQCVESWEYRAWCGYANRKNDLMLKYPTFFEWKPIYKQQQFFFRSLQLSATSEVPIVIAALKDQIDIWGQHVTILNTLKWTISEPVRWDVLDYSSAFELMSSPKVFSGNLCDRKALSELIREVARIDRLPQSSSLISLKLLRTAWEDVDIYTSISSNYKIVSKVSFLLSLGISVAVTILSAVYYQVPGSILTPSIFQIAISVLSLVMAVISGMTTYLNPAVKWQQLKGAAVTMESEIWKYRTRVDVYAIEGSLYESQPEDKLRESVDTIQQNVKKTATVINSTFFSNFSTLGETNSNIRCTHGQYHDSSITGTYGTSNLGQHVEDDHYSPIRPKDYIKLRVRSLLEFYKNRLPRYYYARTVSEVYFVLGSVVGGLMALLNVPGWVVIISAVSAALTAWLEFQGTSKKVVRYGESISQLNQVIMWWDSLTPVDQASTDNVNNLVTTCENIIQGELRSWMSTSMVQKMLDTMGGERPNTGKGSGDE